jgi:hypothetical protein
MDSGLIVENQLRDPQSDIGVFRLPCGYLDDSNALYMEVQLRGTKGVEEDMLSSKRIAADRKMDLLLASCVTAVRVISGPDRVETPPEQEGAQVVADASGAEAILDGAKIQSVVVPQLLSGDRVFLFFSIRRCTHGDIFPIEARCPNSDCKEKDVHSFDLKTLPIQDMPNPRKRVYEATLPISKKHVRHRCMDGRLEQERDRLSKRVNAPTLRLLLRVIDIDGEPPTELVLQNLDSGDRDFLRAEFERVDGGVDTTIELACKYCGEEWETEIDPRQPSFFFPLEVQQRWKRRSST